MDLDDLLDDLDCGAKQPGVEKAKVPVVKVEEQKQNAVHEDDWGDLKPSGGSKA